MEFSLHEEYEKCRALISVLLDNTVSEEDRITLMSILESEYIKLGEVIGTVQTK